MNLNWFAIIRKRGGGRAAAALVSAALLSFFPARTAQADSVEKAVLEARRLELHQSPAWKALLHYKTQRGEEISLIDDPEFFVAPDGRKNSSHELEAFLRGMFDPAESRKLSCSFPARAYWLKQTLTISDQDLPPVHCNELNAFLAEFDPEEASLIIASSYMGNPESFFGHAMIKISGRRSFIVSYDADLQDLRAFSHIYKGLFGGYLGYYKFFPYIEGAEYYADSDRRDAWEYSLLLDSAEIRQMVLHLWELRDVYSRYFFVSENCSSNLIFPLLAARSYADLANGMDVDLGLFAKGWKEPLDLLASAQKAGLLGEMKTFPSKNNLAREIDPLPPHLAHGGSIVSTGPSTAQSTGVRLLAGLGASRHDLLDPPAGREQWSQASIFNMLISTGKKGDVRLESFELFSATSLAVRDEVSKPVSWRAKAEILPKNSNDESELFYSINGGVGGSWALGKKAVYYLMLDAENSYSKAFTAKLGLGAGASTGIAAEISSRWRALISARGLGYFLGGAVPEFAFEHAQTFELKKNMILRFEADAGMALGEHFSSARALLELRF